MKTAPAGFPFPRGRPGLPHQIREGYADRLRDEHEVGETGVTIAALVSLDAATLHTDALGELILRQAGLSAACGDAFTEFPAT